MCTISERIKSEISRKLCEVKSLKQIAIEEKVSTSTAFKELGRLEIDKRSDWMIRDIRINLFNSDNRKYKKYWKLIAKSPVKQFTERQIYRIEKLKKLNEKFSVAYELRKEFYELLIL